MTRVITSRSRMHVPVADAALALANSIGALVNELNAPFTPSQRRNAVSERLRPLVRMHRGIPEPGAPGYAQVLALKIEGWIKQARSTGHAGSWLRAQCVAVDSQFVGVGVSAFDRAVAGLVGAGERPKRGPRPALIAACHLVVAARWHSDAGSLADTASNRKWAGKRATLRAAIRSYA